MYHSFVSEQSPVQHHFLQAEPKRKKPDAKSRAKSRGETKSTTPETAIMTRGFIYKDDESFVVYRRDGTLIVTDENMRQIDDVYFDFDEFIQNQVEGYLKTIRFSSLIKGEKYVDSDGKPIVYQNNGKLKYNGAKFNTFEEFLGSLPLDFFDNVRLYSEDDSDSEEEEARIDTIKKAKYSLKSDEVCRYTPSKPFVSNIIEQHVSVVQLTNKIINDTLRVRNSMNEVPRVWRIACLAEFIISDPSINLQKQPTFNILVERTQLTIVENKLDRTDLISRDTSRNISSIHSIGQKRGILHESSVSSDDIYHAFSDAEFTQNDEDVDGCSGSKQSECKSGVCFSWKGRARSQLNTYATEVPPYESAFENVQLVARYGTKQANIRCKQDRRLRTVKFDELDVPSVWIPSIRKQIGLDEKHHCLNLSHANQLGQCGNYAVVVVVRAAELEWYYTHFYSANTYFVAIDRPELNHKDARTFCVGDAKNVAFLAAHKLGCKRMVLMDDGVHGFEHNSIVSFDDDGHLHTGVDREGLVDMAKVDMTHKDNQRFPMTWSTAFMVMSDTMDITNAALVASATDKHAQEGEHCSEFINRSTMVGKLPNQVWMLDVDKITRDINKNLPPKHYIQSPLHPAYQAGEDVLMNMVLFQRGFRVETIRSFRHRKWAGGTCSVKNGELWNPFLPLVKYRDIYRMVEINSLYVESVASRRPKRGCTGKGVQSHGQPVPIPATLTTHTFNYDGKKLLRYTMNQPLRTHSMQKNDSPERLESVEVAGRTNKENKPVISCQRNGHPTFNVLKQSFELKGYGLRWWHTFVSLDALTKQITGRHFPAAEPKKTGATKTDILTELIQIQKVAGSKQKPIPYVGQYNGKPVFVKKYPSEAAAVAKSKFQLRLDGIKESFGLVSMHLRLDGQWLIGDDFGTGSGYQETNGLLVNETSGAPMLKTYQDKLDDSGLDDTIRILLFRAVFNISDTHFKNIIWSERLQKVVSVDETGERKHDLLELTQLDLTQETVVWQLFWKAMSGTNKRMKCMSDETKLRLESRIIDTCSQLLLMLDVWYEYNTDENVNSRCIHIQEFLQALSKAKTKT
jgi:hypothetical protein